jgi:hypothetical protein
MNDLPVSRIDTFGDCRRLICQTIISLRDGKMDVQTGMAIAANMKMLNDNIKCEVAAAALAIKAHEKGHNFGKVARMGLTAIEGETEAKAI